MDIWRKRGQLWWNHPFLDNSQSLTTWRSSKMPALKIKSMLRTFARGSTSDQRERKNSSLYRLVPLLLLMLYTICSIIRLTTSSSYSSYLGRATDSCKHLYRLSITQNTLIFYILILLFSVFFLFRFVVVTEISSDLESFKTHISSNLNFLQASEENTAHRCSNLINGRENLEKKTQKKRKH